MEYFDVMPDPVKNELVKRGVFTDKLLYCVKSDLDAEGNYIDVYLTFTTETLSAISGYEEFGKLKRGEKRPVLMDFKTCGYEEYPLADIKRSTLTDMQMQPD